MPAASPLIAHGRLSELQRRILRRVGGSSQMETLWHFNDKYQPLWRPRYVVLDTLADAPQRAVAVAAAEGVTEVPVVGRLLGSGAPGAGAGRAGPDRG